MSHKSQIRIKVEQILNLEPQCCFIDKRKNGYRMKLVSSANFLTIELQKKIMKLPHVIRVGYISSGRSFGGFSGYTIFVDCKPSQINNCY